jgi:peptidoglycan/LPS O-acetylase OafA/YrhL
VSPAFRPTHSNNAFDLIRFLAAFGVLYSHSFPLTGRPEPTFIGGETLGSLCVFVFFAVSGYLVKTSWDRSKSALSFVLNRGLRIYPALIVCLILCAFLLGPLVSSLDVTAYFTESAPYRFVSSNLAMFLGARRNDLPGVFVHLPLPIGVNGSLWTIRFEVFMYIAMLVLVTSCSKSSRAIGGMLIVVIGIWGIGMYLGLRNPGDILWHLGYVGLDGRILKLAPFFLIGALLADAPKKILIPSVAMAGVLLALAFSTSPFAILALWLVLPYSVLTFAYHAPKPLNRFGKHGDFSYGIYLYAFPVQQTLSYLQIKNWPTHVITSALITFVLAFFSWKLIEHPALRLKSRYRDKISMRESAASRKVGAS